MQIKTSHFLFPKRSCKPSECEDGLTVCRKTLRFCVTDGASEGFDSRGWARMLAAIWKLNISGLILEPDQLCEVISNLSVKWRERWKDKSLPWYAEEKLKVGSFAAFLGIEIKPEGDLLKWKAIAVGDCCLFIRNKENRLIASFPISSAEEFGNYPILIPTNSNNQLYLKNYIRQDAGVFDFEDTLLLMSDAISSWYMKIGQNDSGKQEKFVQLLQKRNTDSLKELIELERNNQNLRNDDIAIIYISVSPTYKICGPL